MVLHMVSLHLTGAMGSCCLQWSLLLIPRLSEIDSFTEIFPHTNLYGDTHLRPTCLRQKRPNRFPLGLSGKLSSYRPSLSRRERRVGIAGPIFEPDVPLFHLGLPCLPVLARGGLNTGARSGDAGFGGVQPPPLTWTKISDFHHFVFWIFVHW